MKILIIGCGYFGSSIFKYLSQFPEYQIDICDTCWFGEGAANINKMYYFYLFQRDLSQYDAIILTAGHSSVQLVQNDYSGAIWNNLINFLGLLKKINPDQKFIYCSSSSVYGGLEGEYFLETEKKYVCLNAYDLLKYECDLHTSLTDKMCFGLRLGTLSGGLGSILRVDTMCNGFFNSYKTKGSIDVFNGFIRRPIAGINDTCRAIHAILEKGNHENKGIYNIASFNTSVQKLAEQYAKILNCPINYHPNTPSPYNFTVNTSKFILNFDFEYQDTVKSIIKSLDDNWNNIINKGVRDRVPDRSKVTEKYV